MRRILICASSLALMGGAAFAGEVTVNPPGVVIEHRSADAPVVEKKTVTHEEDGCATKTVKKSNEMGDSVTHTKTNC
jgi:hypothetical protein